jgi:hypothetical protein
MRYRVAVVVTRSAPPMEKKAKVLADVEVAAISYLA